MFDSKNIYAETINTRKSILLEISVIDKSICKEYYKNGKSLNYFEKVKSKNKLKKKLKKVVKKLEEYSFLAGCFIFSSY